MPHPVTLGRDLDALLEGGWELTSIQRVRQDLDIRVMLVATRSFRDHIYPEWMLWASYPADPAADGDFDATLYGVPDAYVEITREEFVTISSGYLRDLIPIWEDESRVQHPVSSELDEYGAPADDPQPVDGKDREGLAGWMEVLAVPEVVKDLQARKDELGEFVISVGELAALDPGAKLVIG
ncbi:hypothetical protein ACFWYW_23825 [Nonomuraea sp. NPDC059023]|uniref:hypothetical protein n=1 Tax=unclassified Nonomuraea TaxID=2593643 RepID=UPI0036D058D1